MKVSAILIGVLSLVLFGLSSGAEEPDSKVGLFVEPVISYELGRTTIDYPSPFSSSTGNVEGFGVGAKVGMHFQEAFFFGIDGRYAMPKFKDSSVDYNANAITTNWGPFIGVQMPNLGARVWGSYIIDSELNPEKSGSFDVVFRKGKGFRIGAGFRVTAFSINLEYQQLKYGEMTVEQLGPFTSNSAFTSLNPENKSWIASLSFPIEL